MQLRELYLEDLFRIYARSPEPLDRGPFQGRPTPYRPADFGNPSDQEVENVIRAKLREKLQQQGGSQTVAHYMDFVRRMPGDTERKSYPEWLLSLAIQGGLLLDPGRSTGGITANSLITMYDANVRLSLYVNPAQELARRISADLEAGRLDHLTARRQALNGRNELLTRARSRMSPGAVAFSRAIKETGSTEPQLVEYYVRRLFERDPALMRQHGLQTIDAASPQFRRANYERAIRAMAESEEVSREIIGGAGRTGRAVTGFARLGRAAGPVGTLAGLGISGYEIAEAPEDQRLYVAGREASGFAGGVIGSTAGALVAGWIASAACGPGVPVCAIIISVIVIFGASYGGGVLGETLYEQTSPAPRTDHDHPTHFGHSRWD